MIAFVSASVGHWYPGTLLYAQYRTFPLFVRATQHSGFQKLATVTGIQDASELKAACVEGMKRFRVSQWHDFRLRDQGFIEAMNIEKLDTVK